jgi:nucleoside-diphosphate-sugar epimerase
MARAFAAHAADPDVTIFASGVSNSGETRPEAFARERKLLQRTIAQEHALLVYFSTCSVLDPERQDTAYVGHKLEMESIVACAERFAIFRLPQVVGRTANPFTLTNYLYSRVASGERFSVWADAWRNIIDVEDAAKIAGHMIREPRYGNRIVNVANPISTPVPELVALFERILGVTANCERVAKGDRYPIEVEEAVEAACAVGVDFGPGYLEQVLEKYYGKRRVAS